MPPEIGAGNQVYVKIDTVQRTDIAVKQIKKSFGGPSEAILEAVDVKHDVGIPALTNNNKVELSYNDSFTPLIFSGRVQQNMPRGVKSEGVQWKALGLEALANRYMTKWQGFMSYVYNPDNDIDWNAPSTGTRWSLGEIIVDILEHAIGFQGGGSALPGHHPEVHTPTDTYMPNEILAGWDSTAILALTTEMREVRYTGQRFWDVIRELVARGANHGVYIDPTTRFLAVHDFTTSTNVSLNMGTVGSALADVDEIEDNPLQFSLDGVRTQITIQGYSIKETNPLAVLLDEEGEPILDPSGDEIPDEVTRAESLMEPFWDPANADQVGRIWKIADSTKIPWLHPRYHRYETIGNTWWNTMPILYVDGETLYDPTQRDEYWDWAGRYIGPHFWPWPWYAFIWFVQSYLGVIKINADLSDRTLHIQAVYKAPLNVTAGPGGTAYERYGVIIEDGVSDQEFYEDEVGGILTQE